MAFEIDSRRQATGAGESTGLLVRPDQGCRLTTCKNTNASWACRGRTAALLSFFLCPWAGDAATILDYVGGPVSYQLGDGPGIAVTRASSFTVGAQDVEITSVSFGLYGSPSSEYDTTAYIFSNSGDHPGTLVGSSHRFFPIGFFPGGPYFSFYDYEFASPLSLSAGSTYWAALGDRFAGYVLNFEYSRNLGDFADQGATPSFSEASSGYPPSQWAVNAPEDLTLVYKLEGSVVPEPGSTGLLLMGLGMVFCGSRPLRKSPLRTAI
jgi:hypothetical protein